MEHHRTVPADKTQTAGTTHRAASTLLDKRNNTIGKLTRKQVSDCIHIWAMVYHLRDTEADTPQLYQPPAWFRSRHDKCN